MLSNLKNYLISKKLFKEASQIIILCNGDKSDLMTESSRQIIIDNFKDNLKKLSDKELLDTVVNSILNSPKRDEYIEDIGIPSNLTDEQLNQEIREYYGYVLDSNLLDSIFDAIIDSYGFENIFKIFLPSILQDISQLTDKYYEMYGSELRGNYNPDWLDLDSTLHFLNNEDYFPGLSYLLQDKELKSYIDSLGAEQTDWRPNETIPEDYYAF